MNEKSKSRIWFQNQNGNLDQLEKYQVCYKKQGSKEWDVLEATCVLVFVIHDFGLQNKKKNNMNITKVTKR